jgi:type IV secretion system protein VirB3
MSAAVIHRSLHRHALFMGGDRELVMFSGLGAFLTALGGFSLWSMLAGAVFWIAALIWLRRWAKIDPQFREIWLKHIQEQDLYPAKSFAWRTGGGQGPWKGGR